MQKEFTLKTTPSVGFDPERLRDTLARKFHLDSDFTYTLERRSIDARKSDVKVELKGTVYIGEEPVKSDFELGLRDVSKQERVVIVGFGPAGMFAALRLIELGIKPVILDRGKDVRTRRRDIAAINKEHIVNPESNYCFGEGGAGTYSDGKLYTRSKKRGDVKRILDILVAHGARDDIMYDSHPHIGTNKLPGIVSAIRETILDAGGEIHFNTRVEGLKIVDGELTAVVDQDGQLYEGIGVILATGHSARDIYHLLHNSKVRIDPKPFALGVRVEHPQALIDSIQYHCKSRGDWLPAAAYSLVHQTRLGGKQRGVFSFCMCPGGFIVPAATAPGEVVVNGMSPSRRDSRFANSGIVVAVELEDIKQYAEYGPLAGLMLQSAVEKRACKFAGGDQTAPAQRLVDFIRGKASSTLNETSYQPGIVSRKLDTVLPKDIAARLKVGFKGFGKRMKGYLSNEAQILGVESRTSSPVWIPRNKESYEHITLKRLFPSGEGAGYAGGIVSAAMDGEKSAEKLVALYASKRS